MVIIYTLSPGSIKIVSKYALVIVYNTSIIAEIFFKRLENLNCLKYLYPEALRFRRPTALRIIRIYRQRLITLPSMDSGRGNTDVTRIQIDVYSWTRRGIGFRGVYCKVHTTRRRCTFFELLPLCLDNISHNSWAMVRSGRGIPDHSDFHVDPFLCAGREWTSGLCHNIGQRVPLLDHPIQPQDLDIAIIRQLFQVIMKVVQNTIWLGLIYVNLC